MRGALVAPLPDLFLDGVQCVVVEECLLGGMKSGKATGLCGGRGLCGALVPFRGGAGGGGGSFACNLELVGAVGEVCDACGDRGRAFTCRIQLGVEVLQLFSGVVVFRVAR